eukprot:6230049-Prymnesium_polylepis.1
MEVELPAARKQREASAAAAKQTRVADEAAQQQQAERMKARHLREIEDQVKAFQATFKGARQGMPTWSRRPMCASRCWWSGAGCSSMVWCCVGCVAA